MVLYAVLKVVVLVEISIFNSCSDDKVLWQKLLLTQPFLLYFPFMTMYVSVECLLRLQRSHPIQKLRVSTVLYKFFGHPWNFSFSR